MSESVRRDIPSAIQQLAAKYGLRIVDEDDEGNYSAVWFANSTTGLKVAADWSELRPFVTLYG